MARDTRMGSVGHTAGYTAGVGGGQVDIRPEFSGQPLHLLVQPHRGGAAERVRLTADVPAGLCQEAAQHLEVVDPVPEPLPVPELLAQERGQVLGPDDLRPLGADQRQRPVVDDEDVQRQQAGDRAQLERVLTEPAELDRVLAGHPDGMQAVLLDHPVVGVGAGVVVRGGGDDRSGVAEPEGVLAGRTRPDQAGRGAGGGSGRVRPEHRHLRRLPGVGRGAAAGLGAADGREDLVQRLAARRPLAQGGAEVPDPGLEPVVARTRFRGGHQQPDPLPGPHLTAPVHVGVLPLVVGVRPLGHRYGARRHDLDDVLRGGLAPGAVVQQDLRGAAVPEVQRHVVEEGVGRDGPGDRRGRERCRGQHDATVGQRERRAGAGCHQPPVEVGHEAGPLRIRVRRVERLPVSAEAAGTGERHVAQVRLVHQRGETLAGCVDGSAERCGDLSHQLLLAHRAGPAVVPDELDRLAGSPPVAGQPRDHLRGGRGPPLVAR